MHRAGKNQLWAYTPYNLSAGPFASLNGRPELAAPAIKTIAPVSTVAKVTAIDTDGESKGSTRRFR